MYLHSQLLHSQHLPTVSTYIRSYTDHGARARNLRRAGRRHERCGFQRQLHYTLFRKPSHVYHLPVTSLGYLRTGTSLGHSLRVQPLGHIQVHAHHGHIQAQLLRHFQRGTKRELGIHDGRGEAPIEVDPSGSGVAPTTLAVSTLSGTLRACTKDSSKHGVTRTRSDEALR
jgi:hypothetical protein